MRRHAWLRRIEAALAYIRGWREIELPQPRHALYGFPGVGVPPGRSRKQSIPEFLNPYR